VPSPPRSCRGARRWCRPTAAPKTQAQVHRRAGGLTSGAAARIPEKPARGGEDRADGSAGQRRIGFRVRNRRGRAARPQARDGGGPRRHSARARCRRSCRWATIPRSKLTTARYYTPSGRSIQAKASCPTSVVEDPTAPTTGRLREADLGKASPQRPGGRRSVGESPADQRKTVDGRRGKAACGAARVRLGKGLPVPAALKFLKGLPLATAQRRTGRAREELIGDKADAKSAPPYLRGWNRREARFIPRMTFPLHDDDQLLRYSRHILLPEIGVEGRKSCWLLPRWS